MDPGRGATLAAIGDVHAHWPRLERVLERIAAEKVDGILLVGDLGSHDLSLARLRTPARDALYLESVRELLRRVGELGAPVLWVPGNHDLPDVAGEGNIDHGSAEIAGLRVAGIGGAGPARFGFSYEWGEKEIRAREVPACDVLLCHAPPARTELDVLAGDGRHVGSEALREIAERHDGAYVCGHIHESPGAVQLGRCLCLNVGGLGEPFGRAQVGFVRFSRELPVQWEVVHEDLESGEVRRWRRA
jgi:Icc-related predicted phosphoesterase